MSTWVRTRHFCANTAGGCRLAAADRPFSGAEFRRHGGLCKDGEGGGCGAPLVAGEPLDLRMRMAALAAGATVGLAVAAWGLAQVFFPPPVTGVAFSAPQSQTADSAGTLAVEVVRPTGSTEATTVNYATADGTALAGQDYSAVQGKLHFGAGEQRKSITVPLVPDTSFAKTSRDFRIVLVNVAGQPQHIVRIAPVQVARTEALVVEQSIRALSVVAKDIADLVVRQRMLDIAIVASRERPGEFAEYKEALALVNGNLTRAREAYMQSLRELQSQQPSTVLAAIDRVANDLTQRKFDQQAQATTVMRGHLKELLQQQRPDMDRWANELSSVVPQIGAPAKRQPSA